MHTQDFHCACHSRLWVKLVRFTALLVIKARDSIYILACYGILKTVPFLMHIIETNMIRKSLSLARSL